MNDEARLPVLEASVTMELEKVAHSGLGIAVAGRGEIKAANGLSLLLLAQVVLEEATRQAVNQGDLVLAGVIARATRDLAVFSPSTRMTDAEHADMLAKHKASQQ